jgi:hypothetical protein
MRRPLIQSIPGLESEELENKEGVNRDDILEGP